MKISVLLLSFTMLAFLSCKKEYEQKLEGNYKGTFNRSAPAITFIQSNVTLTLDENSFSGNSDVPKYPAICSGKWTANKKAIEFKNGCAWTADFDHTLILNGEYEYEWSGNKLFIRRTIGDINEVYQLERQ